MKTLIWITIFIVSLVFFIIGANEYITTDTKMLIGFAVLILIIIWIIVLSNKASKRSKNKYNSYKNHLSPISVNNINVMKPITDSKSGPEYSKLCPIPKEEYNKLLQDPRWKRKRDQILERDNRTCQACRTQHNTNAIYFLRVHHKQYLVGAMPWETPDKYLVTLCRECHENEHLTPGYIEWKQLDVIDEQMDNLAKFKGEI